MDRTERFQRIIRKLHEKRLVTRAEIQDELEISLATFKRDLEYLRDRLEAPIIWDAEQGGYRFDQPVAAPRYALPGLWFNADEIHALLAMHSLISGMGERVLDSAVAPVLNRVEKLLEGEGNSAAEVKKRIRVISPGHRALEHDDFGQISQAVLQRKRLHIRYYARGAGETSERDISPQRLVHYRENWYLDAWCHLRKGIRSFAVEEIQSVKALDQAAKEVPDEELDHALGSSYGIFSGVATQVAKLRFTAERARWVKRETWHPAQKGTFDKQGRYTLELPYSDDRELMMDILRHVPEVEVIAPKALREKLLSRLKAYLNENKVIGD
ncbi:MAG: YafY family protein [Pseudomonadota bacterium]